MYRKPSRADSLSTRANNRRARRRHYALMCNALNRITQYYIIYQRYLHNHTIAFGGDTTIVRCARFARFLYIRRRLHSIIIICTSSGPAIVRRRGATTRTAARMLFLLNAIIIEGRYVHNDNIIDPSERPLGEGVHVAGGETST